MDRTTHEAHCGLVGSGGRIVSLLRTNSRPQAALLDRFLSLDVQGRVDRDREAAVAVARDLLRRRVLLRREQHVRLPGPRGDISRIWWGVQQLKEKKGRGREAVANGEKQCLRSCFGAYVLLPDAHPGGARQLSRTSWRHVQRGSDRIPGLNLFPLLAIRPWRPPVRRYDLTGTDNQGKTKIWESRKRAQSL